jgi:two-component system, OmpR family, response regulator VicR
MVKILLIEDDIALSYGVEYSLKKEGFEVNTAKSLEEASERFNSSIDLILLDIMLPDGSGYDFCRKVRLESDVPVIFMTALDEEVNVVLGLDLGGDDYITKPVRVKELVSRINAVLRRRKKLDSGTEPHKIISGGITIEPLKCKVWAREREIALTAVEYKLLLLFLENKGNVLSRSALLERLWDIDGEFVDGNTLNVYVKRLREKLEEDGRNPVYIETVRGIGYRWSEEVRSIGSGSK